MTTRMSKTKESSSDWDSSPELDPKLIIKPKSTLSSKTKSREEKNEETPPFNFRKEVGSISSPREPETKPGLSRKGHVYSPKHQKHSEINSRKDLSDEDDDDPLYSTVKKKKLPPLRQSLRKSRHSSSEGHKKIEVRLPSDIARSKVNSGIDNQAFEEEEIIEDVKQVSNGTIPSLIISNGIEGNAVQHSDRKNSTDQLIKSHFNNSLHYVLSLERSSVPINHHSLESFNHLLSSAFAFLSFPIACFALFVHHFIRFILLGLLKPLLIDTSTVVVALLLQPFTEGIALPLISQVTSISSGMAETVVVCTRPLLLLLQSVKLININKYSGNVHNV